MGTENGRLNLYNRKLEHFKHLFNTHPLFKGRGIFVNDIFEGPYGSIISFWKKTDGKINYVVVVPANSTARLCLNDREILEGKAPIKRSKNLRVEKISENELKINFKPGHYTFYY